MKTPLYIIEEHHEACLALVRAVQAGDLDGPPYHFLHVDEHADMSLPRLRVPLPSLTEEETAWARFVYDELDIGNFIWPLVYLGVVDAVTWLRRQHKRTPVPRRMQICAIDDSRTQFITAGDLGRTRFADRSDIQNVDYAHLSPGEAFAPDRPWVLSIDEDYFAAHAYPRISRQQIEITRASYEEFKGNPYHFLRISPGSKPGVSEENGRYFLHFNTLPETDEPIPTAGEIEERINVLAGMLRAIGRPPSLIVLCRSLHSGYLPPALFAKIENTIVDRLASLYALDISVLSEHLPAAITSNLKFPAREMPR